MSEMTYTESAMVDKIKEYVLSQKEQIKTIEYLGSKGRGIFLFNPGNATLEIQDIFLKYADDFKLIVKRVVSELVAEWFDDDRARSVMNNVNVIISTNTMIKINEWSSDFEGIPVSAKCQIVGSLKEETYTKMAECVCVKCKRRTRLVNNELPTVCENETCTGRKFVIDSTTLKTGDIKTIIIQEPMDEIKHGMPKLLTCIVKDDLVFDAYPGQRKIITGVFHSTPKKNSDRNSVFIHAISMQNLDDDNLRLPSKEKIEYFMSLAKQNNYMKLITDSFAPEIKFREIEKLSVIISRIGSKKQGRIRGNIHTLLIGPPACIVAGSRIALADGQLIKIETLAKNHLDEININILTGKGGKHTAKATKFHKYLNQPVLEIITETGKNIKITKNHPLMITENREYKWRKGEDLKIGDRIKTQISIANRKIKEPFLHFKQTSYNGGPRFKGVLPERLTSDLAGMFGYLIGDGWCTKNKVGFVVVEDEIDLLPLLLEKFEKSFKIKACIQTRIPKESKIGNRVIYPTKRLTYVDYSSNTLVSNLQFIKTKTIPDCIFESSNKSTKEFLKWLFEADGTASPRQRGCGRVMLKSIHVELLRDVQLLLLRFGIQSRIYNDNLTIQRGQDIIRFYNEIGFVSSKKQQKLKNLIPICEKKNRVNRQFTEKIKKIIFHPEGQTVYDIEVPQHHQFIANGIVNHNTAKSKILEFLPEVTQRCGMATGGMSTGSGITVTMTTLPDKTKFPKGGIVVQCSGSCVVLDELNQFPDEDIGKTYTAMESGKIPYNKGGFDQVFTADTTIIAGANPKNGYYHAPLGMVKNINLPKPMISRFDLIINVLPESSEIQSQQISDHTYMIKDLGVDKFIKENNLFNSENLTELFNYASTLTVTFSPDAKTIIDDYVKVMMKLQQTGEQTEGSKQFDRRFIESIQRVSEALTKLHFQTVITKEFAVMAIEYIKKTLETFGLKTDMGVTTIPLENIDLKDKNMAFENCWIQMCKDAESQLLPEYDFLKFLCESNPKLFPTMDKAAKLFKEIHEKGDLIHENGRFRMVK